MKTKRPYIRHYLVITEFNQVVHSTEDLEVAKRECAEWAEYDDILVVVQDSMLPGQNYEEIYRVDGYSEAVAILYPEEEEI
jgi:hypothetical protein